MKVAYVLILAAAAGIGVAAANYDWGLGATVLVPAMSYMQPSRRAAYATAMVYYAGASYLLIPAAVAFFGPHTTPVLAGLLWITSALLLASPYALLWNSRRSAALWRVPLAILASVPPPLGLIGWASPLTSAGLLFPGTAWLGILAVLEVPAMLLVCVKPAAAVTIVAVLAAHVCAPAAKLQPPEWEAVNLSVPGRTWTMAEEYAIARTIQERALTSKAKIIVFPETSVPRWSEATAAFWFPTFETLRSQGRIVMFGTTLAIEGTERFKNVILARGAVESEIDQHVPIPIGMWRPFAGSGAPLNLSTVPTATLGGSEVASLICYEHFLVFPILSAMVLQPTVLVGISNTAWEPHGRLMNRQMRLLRAWSHLFNVPMVFSAAHAGAALPSR